MPIEFRPDGSPIEIDSTYSEVPGTRRFGRRLFSNGRRAAEIIIGKKRERLLAEYTRLHFKPERTEVVVVPEQKEVAPAAVEVVEQFIDTKIHAQIVQTDDEAEQEFLNAVPADDRELYKPKEDEWFSACVVHRDWKGGKYLLLELSTKDVVYCPWQRVTRSPGNHSLCLALNTECSVRMKLDRGKYFALEMQTECKEPPVISRAQITTWRGMAGSAYRECLCPIFVLCTRENWEIASTLQVGDWVEIVHRPSEKRGWVGFIQRKISAPTAQGEK